jgi:AhpD family alkylhydroperoxidase
MQIKAPARLGEDKAGHNKEPAMSYKAKSAEMRAELRVMNRLIPATAAGFADLSKAAKTEGSLSVKEREYVALAIAITQHCEPCIGFHIEALQKTDATREDLAALMSMCIQMGGGPALMYAAHALAAWDEMAAPPA